MQTHSFSKCILREFRSSTRVSPVFWLVKQLKWVKFGSGGCLIIVLRWCQDEHVKPMSHEFWHTCYLLILVAYFSPGIQIFIFRFYTYRYVSSAAPCNTYEQFPWLDLVKSHKTDGGPTNPAAWQVLWTSFHGFSRLRGKRHQASAQTGQRRMTTCIRQGCRFKYMFDHFWWLEMIIFAPQYTFTTFNLNFLFKENSSSAAAKLVLPTATLSFSVDRG